MTLQLTKGKFLNHQRKFHKTVLATPFDVELEIFTVQKPADPTKFSLEEFVGDSKRDSKRYKFRALYEREIPPRVREKYGLPMEVNGIIYLSPLQLVPVFKTFHLDWNKTKVHFAGRVQVIEKIELLEPLFDSCVGIQLFVKDDLKA